MARILIIEGGREVAAALQAGLAGQEYALETRPSLSHSDRLLFDPDLVVIGVTRERGAAAALTRSLLARPDLAGVPLLAMGSADCEAEIFACLEAGAADCLLMPGHAVVVRARVMALVRARQDRCAQEILSRVLEDRRRALESTVEAMRESDRVLDEAQRRQRYLATHDGLTGLPNRAMFCQFAEKALSYARRHSQTLAVISLDLDRFRAINENLGDVAGDHLLEEVGRQLLQCVRRSDMVARLGGDDFVVLLANLGGRGDAATVAEKIHALISRPHRIDGHELFVTPSIGVAVFPDDGDSTETLMNRAELAQKRVKEQGRGQFTFYSSEMEGQSLERMKLEHHLRRAVERGELRLYFQPKVDVLKGMMTGCEALVRWMHPERGMVSPGEFIPIAENAGLIGQIGEWVLREACRQKRAWESQGLGGFPVSVNVSFRQLRSGTLDSIVSRILEETGLEPSHLDLEITENSIMDDLDAALRSLTRLEQMGVRISIDDFGTGYSSLSVLGKFPAHALKIDQVFVRDIESDGTNAAITRAVIAIAEQLGLGIVAEGVETEASMQFLAKLGVSQMQGYLFDRPLPADAFVERWADDPTTIHRV
jgi:diguanylate cyclase (GGDEF)-like protein